ncbi:MAG TPA: FecR domain-containing protein [Methylomirabilota bacterium]
MGAQLARHALAVMLLALLCPVHEAAASGAGVVTGVSGQVTVSRTAATSIPLRFKDEVFLKDRISTAEHSLARLLLDQKALVTVRELSELEITEQAGRSTVDLGAGKIAIGVARQRMRSGEIVEIRTQNAVAAIRGTMVIAEAIPVPPGAPPQSRIHVLSGYVDITPRDNPAAPPVRMVAPASISITGASVGLPVPLNEAARHQLLSDLHQTLPQHLSAMKALASGEFARATALARIITGGSGAGGDKTLDVHDAPTDVSSGPGKAPITPITLITPSTPSGGGSPVAPPPLFAYTNQTANIPGDLYQVAPSVVQSLSTDLLRATNSALDFGSDVLEVKGSLSSGTPRAFVGLDGSIVSAQTLMRLQQGALSMSGALLDAVNSVLTVRGPALLEVQSGASLTGFGSSSFVSFTNGLLLLGPGANGFHFASGATASLGGTLLKTEGTIVAGLGDLVSVKAATLSVGAGGPALDFHGATMVGPDLGDVRSNGQLNLGGGFARATGGTLWAPNHFLRVTGGALSSSGSASLFDFTNTTLTVGLLPGGALFETSSSATVSDTTGHPLAHIDGGSLLLSPGTKGFLAASQGTLDVHGGLLDAVNTALTSSDDFILGSGRGRITQTGSAAPLVRITGGTHHIATAGSIFHLVGTASALDLASGLIVGTEKPVQPGGTLLELAGATVTSGRAVTVDVALLQAIAPLLNLRPDALGNGASLTTSGNTLDLTSKAKLDSTATLFSLDKSQLAVTNAALAAVARGSYLRTAGDFMSLANGSTLTINNGVLLFASGGSVVNIRGALIAFSGTPGNTVAIANALAFVTIGGIPVALTGGALAGNVLITGAAIKNPGLGTITPNKALIRVDGATTKITISGN